MQNFAVAKFFEIIFYRDFTDMYNTHYLKNGICLVYEKMPYAKSVSVGIWVKAGSMYEAAEENGISHFIEHMLFKGTEKRSAKAIAEETDFVGGQINAYTSRECTCYYTKTLEENMPLSLEILSDMYHNSLFKEEDIELERGVILEEINMYEDSPEDVALDGVLAKMWKKSPLGLKVEGTTDSVNSITRDMMLSYMKRRYNAKNTVISVAGGFDEKVLIALCEEYFSREDDYVPESPTETVFYSGMHRQKKEIEQAHLAIAYPSYDMFSERLYSQSLMNSIFGGSMSSRLFQSVRENHGLCYSIYSYTSSFANAGMLGIYAGLSSDAIDEAQDMIEKEIHTICTKPVSDYELEKVKNHLRCSIIMSRESAGSRMNENGKSMLLLGRVRTDDEIIEKIGDVTPGDILHDANYIFNSGEKAVFILEN